MTYFIALLCLSVASFANAATATGALTPQAAQLHYSIIGERSHNTELFTQGLLIYQNAFYESSGRYYRSLLVSYPIAEPTSHRPGVSATFGQKKSVPREYFAEGLTELNNKLYQLTWRERSLLIYDAHNFNLIKTLNYSGEGWGLTHNGKQLIRSDGSSTLFFHNPESFAVEKTIAVRLEQQAMTNLNELEYGEGFIWANIWLDNRILKIDPVSGQVVGILDLSAVVQSLKLDDRESVLNGIAYDAQKKALWVTGKQWPKMFLVKITQ